MIEDAKTFRRYILGELDESEQENVEKKLMTSDEHFQELLIAEDEIVDDYFAGKLSPSEAEKYRQRFLVTPERRQQHRFGAALSKRLSAEAAPAPVPKKTRSVLGIPWSQLWKSALPVALVALLVVGLWWFLRPRVVRLEQVAQQVEGPTAAFFLTTGRLRSLEPELQTVTVPAGIAFVELQLDLPEDSVLEYGVTLEDAQNDKILAEGTLPAQTIEGQPIVVATVPSKLLAPGDYRVIVRAPPEEGELAFLGTYEFRVPSPVAP
ncbi:MAG TPA: hypothetical protein VLK65_21345 [Vicinamibacteria bacterium]|nr:hypothetical protein [Vicinamibacteria bacterium]